MTINWNDYELEEDEPEKQVNTQQIPQESPIDWGSYDLEEDEPEILDNTQYQTENNAGEEDEDFWKSAFRTASQIPQGIAEGTGYGLFTNLSNLLAFGDVMDPEEMERIKAISEREGVPFDEEKYKEAAQQAISSFPTPSNIARMVENTTGLPLEAKTEIQKALKFAGMAGKLTPGNVPQRLVGAGAATATKTGLEHAGVPETLSELAGLGIGGIAGSKTPQFNVEFGKTKPSGIPARGFEKLKSPTPVSESKISQINQKLESDFRKVSDKIIAESPIGDTATNLAQNPAFKQESRELLNQAQQIADSVSETISRKSLRKEIADTARNKVKGFALSEYDKSYLKFMRESAKDIVAENVTPGELVQQYRKNNSSLSEYFEPGASKALNRAKRDALLDNNRAIANVIEQTNPELAKVFKEGNARWTKIMDAEAVDSFVNEIFEGKVNYKKIHDFFDKEGHGRIFKRALGEKGYANFNQLMKDISTSEAPYKMLKIAKDRGFEDLFKAGIGYVIHPKIGIAKAGYDTLKASYRGLMNAMLDKPQIGIHFKKAMKDLKSGKFPDAEREFNIVKEESQPNRTIEMKPKPISKNENTFKTSKGSEYTVNSDGTTTRNKVFRPEHGNKEQGIQPTSEKTWFVSPEDALKLGEVQTSGPGKSIIELPDGRIGVKYLSGKDSGKIEGRTVVTPKNSPQKGFIPIEIFESGKKVHFGNEITEVSKQLESPQKKIENKPIVKNNNISEMKIKTEKERFRSRFSHKKEAYDENNNILGSISYDLEPSGELYISDIHVDVPFRRKGVAKNLMKDLLEKQENKKIILSPLQPDGAEFFSKIIGRKLKPQLTSNYDKINGISQLPTELSNKDIINAKKNLGILGKSKKSIKNKNPR